jgi:hypothetical protein
LVKTASIPAASSSAPSLPTCRSSRPSGFQLVINRGTATLLGIEVPPQLLAIADEVID